MNNDNIRQLFEERAAIMQFDGKMSKEAAEREAAKEQTRDEFNFDWEQSRR